MSVVLDASVLVAALVDSGSAGSWAEQVLSQGDLFAPELLPAEAVNTLRRLEQAREITTAEANAAEEEIGVLPLTLFPFAPFAERVWALRHNMTSYDGWYAAMAEALGMPLATLDRRLARTAGLCCSFLLP